MPHMKTKTDLLKDARSQVAEVTAAEIARQSPKPLLIDVREKQETDAGLLPDAKDRRLMVSLPRAVELAMREHPALQATMSAMAGAAGIA